MLLRLHHLALKLAWCRSLSIIFAIGALFLSIYCLLIDDSFTSRALEPAIVIALWGLMIFSFLQIFLTIPPPVLPHDSFLKKLSTRIKLLLYTLLAFVVCTTSIFLLWMSIRLLLL